MSNPKYGGYRKPKLIETPERLYDLWLEYKQWCRDNPYTKNDFRGSEAKEVLLKQERPHTIAGFEAYLSERNIVHDLGYYFSNGRNGSYSEYADVVTQIRAESKSQVLNGALAGVFNGPLAARYLGIPQIVEQTVIHEMQADVKELDDNQLKQLENIIDAQYNKPKEV